MSSAKSKEMPASKRRASKNPEDHSDLVRLIQYYWPDQLFYKEIYKDIHRYPELGTHESRTSEIARKHLEELGFEVKCHVGGYGVIGVLKNGPGRKVMLRADMDALPIKEDTGLPYASQVVFKDVHGTETPVMHASGQDMHVAALLGAAGLMAKAHKQWSGTLICIFQPDRLNGAGAQAMVTAGLLDLAPKPDIILAQYVDQRRSGEIGIQSGRCGPVAESFLVTVHGKGGHSSKPESCIDPVLIACHMIVRLQTVVSRLVAPQDQVVLTCGSFNCGNTYNVIPETVQFRVDLWTYGEAVRTRAIKAICDIVNFEAAAGNATSALVIERTHKYAPTFNDPKSTADIREVFVDGFGESRIGKMEKFRGSEDFPNLALAYTVPCVIWSFGATDHNQYDQAVRDDTLHDLPPICSSKFAPCIEPTLETGIKAMSLAALCYLT